MIKYYLISPEIDSSIIGVKKFETQALIDRACFEDKKNYDLLIKVLGSNYYWEKNIEIKNLDVNVERVSAHPRAYITDFLRFSPGLINTYFMVSARIKKVIERYSKHGVVFFDTFLSHDSVTLDYSLMYIESLDKSCIDYKRSIFTGGDEFIGKNVVEVSSPEEETELAKKYFDLSISVIKLQNIGLFNKDIFTIEGEIFVSERLMKDLAHNQASGIQLLPAYEDVDGRIKIVC